jgi:peptidoglycan/LPS O-acetylase OafA/YrhL
MVAVVAVIVVALAVVIAVAVMAIAVAAQALVLMVTLHTPKAAWSEVYLAPTHLAQMMALDILIAVSTSSRNQQSKNMVVDFWT